MLSPPNASLSHHIFAFPTAPREAAWGAMDEAALSWSWMLRAASQ